MDFKTEQEKFWAKEFGDDYIERNQSEQLLASNIVFFTNALAKADKINSSASDLGGDIYIHGDCVTVGCLPMTDDLMEYIYIITTHAKNNGQVNIQERNLPFRELIVQ